MRIRVVLYEEIKPDTIIETREILRIGETGQTIELARTSDMKEYTFAELVNSGGVTYLIHHQQFLNF